jgi:hypothetical protein
MVELRILGPRDKNENVLVLLWEGVIDAVNWVLKNKKEDQLATKIPLEGRFDSPRTNIISTIFERPSKMVSYRPSITLWTMRSISILLVQGR